MNDTVRVEGLAQLSRNLQRLQRELGPQTTKNPVLRSLRAAGRVIVKEARSRVPERTGRLSRAIGTIRDRRPGIDGFQEQIFIKPREGRSRDDQRGAWYWRFVEFGRGEYQLDKPRTINVPGVGPVTITKVGAVKAQPFMTPAFESKKRASIDKFAEEIRKDIARLEKQLAVRGRR